MMTTTIYFGTVFQALGAESDTFLFTFSLCRNKVLQLKAAQAWEFTQNRLKNAVKFRLQSLPDESDDFLHKVFQICLCAEKP